MDGIGGRAIRLNAVLAISARCAGALLKPRLAVPVVLQDLPSKDRLLLPLLP